MPVVKTNAEYLERKARDEFRQKIIIDVVTQLTAVDQKRLNEMKAKIINDHVQLTGTDGFYHNGMFYTNMSGVPVKSMQKLPIHPTLKGQAIEHDKQVRALASDTAKISRGLAVLIRNCIDYQGVRNALPDVLIPITTITEIARHDRTMPEGYTLTSKLHKDQFQNTLDRIYFYLGSRLLG